MASDTRGTDLNSWWSNRAEFREHAAQGAAKLREARARLMAAIPNTRIAEEDLSDDDSVENILRDSNTALTALANAQAQFPKLNAALESEKGSFNGLTNQVRAAAQQAARTRAEQEARNALQSKRNWLVKQQKTRKFVAAVIFVLVLYVLIQY